MALSDERIKAIFIESWGAIPPPALLGTEMVHARAIEAEVRKQDEALIRQMLIAMEAGLQEVKATAESEGVYFGGDSDVDSKLEEAITAARARLGTNPPPGPDVPKTEA